MNLVKEFKKKIGIMCLFVFMSGFLSSCDETNYFEYDPVSYYLNEKVFNDYFEISLFKGRKNLDFPVDELSFSYEIAPVQNTTCNNCEITLVYSVNEIEQSFQIELDEDGFASGKIAIDVEYAYDFNCNYYISSANGKFTSGTIPYQSEYINSNKTIYTIGYVKYNKLRYEYKKTTVGYTGELVKHPFSGNQQPETIEKPGLYLKGNKGKYKKVIYLTNEVYTKSGIKLYYRGDNYYNAVSSRTETLIFDGNMDIDVFYRYLGREDYVEENLKNSKIKNIYIKNITIPENYDLEWLKEREFAFPEHGINFYIGNNKALVKKLFLKFPFVNGVYDISEFEIKEKYKDNGWW